MDDPKWDSDGEPEESVRKRRQKLPMPPSCNACTINSIGINALGPSAWRHPTRHNIRGYSQPGEETVPRPLAFDASGGVRAPCSAASEPVSHAVAWCGWQVTPIDILLHFSHDLTMPASRWYPTFGEQPTHPYGPAIVGCTLTKPLQHLPPKDHLWENSHLRGQTPILSLTSRWDLRCATRKFWLSVLEPLRM